MHQISKHLQKEPHDDFAFSIILNAVYNLYRTVESFSLLLVTTKFTFASLLYY